MKKSTTIAIILLLTVALPVFAASNLWEYYREQGEILPTVQERASLAEFLCGISNYRGTYNQNVAFLDCLLYGEIEYERFGATIPKAVAVFETSLAAKITSSATTMTLVSGTDASGDDLSGYICFVIDEGEPSEEFVCGTANATSITSMIRGIDPVDGDEEVASLKSFHRRGASVKITNHPQLAIISRIMNGDETFPNILQYASTITTSSLSANNQYIASVGYVNDVSVAGASNADRDTRGIVEIATLEEMRSGTSTGSTGALLVPEVKWFASTSPGTSSIPIADTDGYLDQSWWDLTEDFSFTASTTMVWASTSELAVARTLSVGATSTLATTVFSALPKVPATDPSSDNELSRKAYVDTFQKYTTSSSKGGERALGTAYQNTGTEWMMVIATLKVSYNPAGSAGCGLMIASSTSQTKHNWMLVSKVYSDRDDAGGDVHTVSAPVIAMIEPNYWYVATSTDGTGCTAVDSWNEAY